MKFVILCEGSDDLWFIAYFLNKSCGWDIDGSRKKWKTYKVPLDRYQEAQYIHRADMRNVGVIVAVGGQDRFEGKIREISKINSSYPQDPINAVIIFRDCDERNQNELAESMSGWFGNGIRLQNNNVCVLHSNIEETDVDVSILPVVIPFHEQGAVETLLLKSIEDKGTDGAYVADHARAYIEDMSAHVTEYLTHDRLVTKAKLSAAIAVTNPDHSTKRFGDLMNMSDWEKSPEIRRHFEEILRLIN